MNFVIKLKSIPNTPFIGKWAVYGKRHNICCLKSSDLSIDIKWIGTTTIKESYVRSKHQIG